MLFHEIYGAYYRTMGRILSAAVSHPVTQEEIRRIIRTHAFGESALAIESAIREERWQLLHPDGTETLYAHLQYLYVRTGETVQAGQILGTAGQTGRATGAHLHFELRRQGAACDPSALLGLSDA